LLARNAGVAGVNATLQFAGRDAACLCHRDGAFPEADATMALYRDWVRARTANPRTTKGLKN
jgi:hypothetical protein